MWWSPDDGDGVCLMMMQLGDALMMPYVFIVFIDACGWIPCYMMPWGHDGDDMTNIDVML